MQRRSPVRLVLALSVAAALAVFLLYTSIAGGGTPQVSPSQLAGRTGTVDVVGIVLKPVSGDAYGKQGLHFRVRDRKGTVSVPVVFHGSVPDLFKPGREVVLTGVPQGHVFAATQLITKCPSKYQKTS